MKVFIVALLTVACIGVFTGRILSPTEAAGASTLDGGWGPTVDGVQMSLSTIDSADKNTRDLQIAVRNVGDHDTTLNLGSMLANGKVQLPDNISLKFTDAKGSTRIFKFADKNHGFIAGRVDDYVVPLRVGSTYTLKVSVDQFWCHDTNEFEIKLLSGKNHLTAQFEGRGAKWVNLDMPAIKLMNFWLGKVESSTVEVGK